MSTAQRFDAWRQGRRRETAPGGTQGRPKSYVANIVVLLSGTALGQLIPLAATPVLTRLYRPDSFGALAVFVACLGIAAIFATGRYELALVLPKAEETAGRLVTQISLIALGSSILFALGLLTINYLAPSKLQALPSGSVLLLPVALLATGFYQARYYWLNRHGEYRSMSTSRIAIAASTVLVQILIGFTAAAADSSLAVGHVFGLLVGALCLGIRSRPTMKSSVPKDAPRAAFDLATLREYRRFPMLLVPAHTMNFVATQAPVFFLAAFVGVAEAGLYAVTVRLTRGPLSFMSTAVGDIFRQEAAERYRTTGSCLAVYDRTMKRLVLVAVPMSLILALVTPLLIPVLLGDRWTDVGDYIRILTPLIILQFISSPLSNMYLIAQHQGADLTFQTLLLVFAIAPFFIGSQAGFSVHLMLTLFSGLYSIAYLLNLFITRKFARGHG